MKRLLWARARNSLRQATRRPVGAAGMVLLLPIAATVGESPGDSAYTALGFTGGGGAALQVTRGCSGEVLATDEVPFQEATFSIEHCGGGAAHSGLQLGWCSVADDFRGDDGSFSAFHVRPSVAYEGRRFGIGGGLLITGLPFEEFLMQTGSSGRIQVLPTGHVRIGTAASYLSLHILEGDPVVAGGGFFAGGWGFVPRPGASAWIGFCSPLPYDGWGGLAQAAVPIGERSRLRLGLRYGISEGAREYGLSLGLDYRLPSTH